MLRHLLELRPGGDARQAKIDRRRASFAQATLKPIALGFAPPRRSLAPSGEPSAESDG
jgi:hypothetical protein